MMTNRGPLDHDDEHSVDEFDDELHNDEYDDCTRSVLRAYSYIVMTYLSGDMDSFKQIIAPISVDEEDEIAEKAISTYKADNIILYALEISEEENYVPFIKVSIAKSNAKEINTIIKADDPSIAKEIIAAILAQGADDPPCYSLDNMLRIAVARGLSLVSKLLALDLPLHPAAVLPKVDYLGRHGDKKYAAIKTCLLADPRVDQVDIHTLTWAAYQGDLPKLEALLSDPNLIVTEKADLPLYWSLKNSQFEAFTKLLADPRFNQYDNILQAFQHISFFTNDRAIPMIKPLLEACDFHQEVFSMMLRHAARGKALGLMETLLADPEYTDLVKGLNQVDIRDLYAWAIASAIHPKRCAEACNLLNKHLVLCDKSEYIVSHYTRYSNHIYPYLKYIILNESEMLDLIVYFGQDRLSTRLFRGCVPIGTQIAFEIERRIENGEDVIGSFDNALLKLFDLMPRPPVAESWKDVIDIFDVVSTISSIETIVSLAERLKTERASDGVLLHRINDEIRQHIDADIQQQKNDAFIRLLDLPNAQGKLGLLPYSSDDRENLIRGIQCMHPEAFEQLLIEAEEKNNRMLLKDLAQIKAERDEGLFNKHKKTQLLGYQAHMQKCENEAEGQTLGVSEQISLPAEENVGHASSVYPHKNIKN